MINKINDKEDCRVKILHFIKRFICLGLLYFFLCLLSLPVISSMELYPDCISSISVFAMSLVIAILLSVIFSLVLYIKRMFIITVVLNMLLILNLVVFSLINISSSLINTLNTYITENLIDLEYSDLLNIELSIITIFVSISIPLIIIIINNKITLKNNRELDIRKYKPYVRILEDNSNNIIIYTYKIYLTNHDIEKDTSKLNIEKFYLQNISDNIIRINTENIFVNANDDWVWIPQLFTGKITDLLLKKDEQIEFNINFSITPKSNIKFPDYKILIKCFSLINDETKYQIIYKDHKFILEEL